MPPAQEGAKVELELYDSLFAGSYAPAIICLLVDVALRDSLQSMGAKSIEETNFCEYEFYNNEEYSCLLPSSIVLCSKGHFWLTFGKLCSAKASLLLI